MNLEKDVQSTTCSSCQCNVNKLLSIFHMSTTNITSHLHDYFYYLFLQNGADLYALYANLEDPKASIKHTDVPQ